MPSWNPVHRSRIKGLLNCQFSAQFPFSRIAFEAHTLVSLEQLKLFSRACRDGIFSLRYQKLRTRKLPLGNLARILLVRSVNGQRRSGS